MPQFGGIEGALAKEMNEPVESEEDRLAREKREKDELELRLKQEREQMLKDHEQDIVKAQSRVRGFL